MPIQSCKSALSQHNVCVIVISQYREKIGVMFGNPTTTQGGHALKFYSDVRIELSRSLAKDGDVTYGNITKLKAIKNKMSPPYRQSHFEIVYGQGIDKVGELMELINEYHATEHPNELAKPVKDGDDIHLLVMLAGG